MERSVGERRGSALFCEEHFPYVKTGRGESAHLLASANSGLAVSIIPLPLHASFPHPFQLQVLISPTG